MKYVIVAALFLLAGTASGQQPDWSQAAKIEVDLSSFKISPDVLQLKHGQAYSITFHNSSSGGHDFVAKDFFAHATLAPDQSALAHGEIELHGGESATVMLIAPSAGTYETHCSHPMHKAMGMKGQIVVE